MVASVLLLGALAPVCASDVIKDIDSVANEHLAMCVTPYIQASLPGQDAVLARLLESQGGVQLIARLRDGAPTQWRAYIDDAGQPLDERVEAAVTMVGMAISHGDGHQKAIARAYSAYFLSVVTQGECPAPAELASFVANHTFWPAQSAAPTPSVPPIVPNP